MYPMCFVHLDSTMVSYEQFYVTKILTASMFRAPYCNSCTGYGRAFGSSGASLVAQYSLSHLSGVVLSVQLPQSWLSVCCRVPNSSCPVCYHGNLFSLQAVVSTDDASLSGAGGWLSSVGTFLAKSFYW